MEFVVILRATDSSNLPPQAVLSLAKQTFQQLVSKQDKRIKAQYGFAGERAGILVVDVSSADELQEVLSNLPFAGITKAEVHAVSSVESNLKTIEAAERRVASMMSAGVR